MTQRSLTVGVGALSGADVVLDLGAHHPTSDGVLRLAVVLDGDTVVSAEPVVGFVHRGAEKLFEVRDYRQVVVLANRHDWHSAFANELGVVLAVERMMGLEVPDRAVWLRTLLAELTRVTSHLAFLSAVAPCHALREAVLLVLEEATGGRVHHAMNRVGGLKEDVPAGWPGRVAAALTVVRAGLPAVASALEDPGFVDTHRGVGVLPVALCPSYGLTGPVARASGWDADLRRDDPYLAYGALDVEVVLGTAGDSLERWSVLLRQVAVSLDLVEACLAALPTGAVSVRLPKAVKAPEGSTYAWTENPLGVMGYYLVSRGEKTPWRLAMRTASFNHASVLPELLRGARLEDLASVLASMFLVLGDLDK